MAEGTLMQALPADDPRVIAWTEYKQTEAFENARRWAMEPLHVEGSLWAAFLAGIDATRTLPINADELRLRGTDADLEGKAIDVVLRCGWPRHDDPLGMTPCVPVPVKWLLEWRDDIEKNGPRVEQHIEQVLNDQHRIQGLYLQPPPPS